MTNIYIYCVFDGAGIFLGVYSSLKAAHRDALRAANKGHVSELTKNGERDIKKLVSSWNEGEDFKTRNQAISKFIEESRLSDDLAISFLQSNGFYRYSQKKTNKDIKKIKRAYVKVMWLSRPSDYNVTITRRKIDWFPEGWLRIVKQSKKDVDMKTKI